MTDKHKTKSVVSPLDFLSRYEEEGDGFLDQIVISDEIRVSVVGMSKLSIVNSLGSHLIAPKTHKMLPNILNKKLIMTVLG